MVVETRRGTPYFRDSSSAQDTGREALNAWKRSRSSSLRGGHVDRHHVNSPDGWHQLSQGSAKLAFGCFHTGNGDEHGGSPKGFSRQRGLQAQLYLQAVSREKLAAFVRILCGSEA